MASKLLRDRIIKPKDQRRTDVLALEKAAAWAWYQRGSGSEGKIMGESHSTRTQRDHHRPSRYKLEAMRMASSSSSSQETKKEGLSSCPVQQTKKLPLLDEYEVRSILTRVLDSLIAESSDNDKLDDGGQRRMMKKKKRRRVRVMCSTRKEDVVEYGRRDSKESRQIQPSAAKCSMPRANYNGGRVM